ncbi:hypothetical protein Bbelb_391750 [Branchiostoma belcheri]|nr:hypothetical protein Bbelb_391750 [Branchiostoma belcheri]
MASEQVLGSSSRYPKRFTCPAPIEEASICTALAVLGQAGLASTSQTAQACTCLVFHFCLTPKPLTSLPLRPLLTADLCQGRMTGERGEIWEPVKLLEIRPDKMATLCTVFPQTPPDCLLTEHYNKKVSMPKILCVLQGHCSCQWLTGHILGIADWAGYIGFTDRTIMVVSSNKDSPTVLRCLYLIKRAWNKPNSSNSGGKHRECYYRRPDNQDICLQYLCYQTTA